MSHQLLLSYWPSAFFFSIIFGSAMGGVIVYVCSAVWIAGKVEKHTVPPGMCVLSYKDGHAFVYEVAEYVWVTEISESDAV